MTSSAPVVLLSIPHGGSAGNVLRTGLVNRLLASEGFTVDHLIHGEDGILAAEAIYDALQAKGNR